MRLDSIILKTATVVLWSTLALGAATGSARSDQPADIPILNPPPSNGQPLKVYVGLYFLNLAALDEINQQFKFTGDLFARWKDPRLAFISSPGEQFRRYNPADVWRPILQIDNGVEPRNRGAAIVLAAPDGTAIYIENFTATLSTDLDFRSFPFDLQTMQVVIHPLVSQSDGIELVPDAHRTGLSREPYTSLPLWRLVGLSFQKQAEIFNEAGLQLSTIEFDVDLQRNFEYYVWRIFLPMFLMVAISWTVLWISPADLNNQILVALTTVLTLVAFSFSVSIVIPPVPYLTYYDAFFLNSYFFVLIVLGELMIVNVNHSRHGEESARRMRRLSRRVVPISYFVVNGILLLRFVVLR